MGVSTVTALLMAEKHQQCKYSRKPDTTASSVACDCVTVWRARLQCKLQWQGSMGIYLSEMQQDGSDDNDGGGGGGATV